MSKAEGCRQARGTKGALKDRVKPSSGLGGLRDQVLSAVKLELDRVGPDSFQLAEITRVFKGTIARTVLLRWIGDAMELDRAERSKFASGDEAAGVGANGTANGLKRSITMMEPSSDPRTICRHMAKLLEAADECMREARGEYGAPRDPKLMLRTLEVGRKCTESVTRLMKELSYTDQVDIFHDQIMSEIATESPRTAERILMRMTRILEAPPDLKRK